MSATIPARGGFSIYVPEFLRAGAKLAARLRATAAAATVFVSLELAADGARAGAIVVAPTAIGRTWALMGEDVDTPNLLRILDFVRGRLNVDSARLLP